MSDEQPKRYIVWARDEQAEPLCETDDAAEAVREFFLHAREQLVAAEGLRGGVLVLQDNTIGELELSVIALAIERPVTGTEVVSLLTGLTYEQVLELGPPGYRECYKLN